MNRPRLIWFAAGVATSAGVSLVATSFVLEPIMPTPSLILYEPELALNTALSNIESKLIPSETGELLRDCGARYFEIDLGERELTAELQLTEENAGAFECVLNGARVRDYRVGIELLHD